MYSKTQLILMNENLKIEKTFCFSALCMPIQYCILHHSKGRKDSCVQQENLFSNTNVQREEKEKEKAKGAQEDEKVKVITSVSNSPDSTATLMSVITLTRSTSSPG